MLVDISTERRGDRRRRPSRGGWHAKLMREVSAGRETAATVAVQARVWDAFGEVTEDDFQRTFRKVMESHLATQVGQAWRT